MANSHFTPENFDPNRVLWGHSCYEFGIEFDEPHLGIDPRHPHYVARRRGVYKIDETSGVGTLLSPTELQSQVDATEVALHQMQKHGIRIPKRSNYYVRPHPENPEEGIAYFYVKRLHGEKLDPRIPEHAPHILALGQVLLNYLAEIPEDEQVFGEACYLRNYTLARPYGSSPDTELAPYMHDLDPLARPKEQPGHEDEYSGAGFEAAISEIRAGLFGIRANMANAQQEELRQQLAAEAEALQAPYSPVYV